jgi:hypothetical protein
MNHLHDHAGARTWQTADDGDERGVVHRGSS